MGRVKVLLMGFYVVLLMIVCCNIEATEAIVPKHVFKLIKKVNKRGPFTGVVVPSKSELEPLLGSSPFHPDGKHELVDLAGRKFHVGHIKNKNMIVAATGKGMINAAITTQMLCSLFRVKRVLHYGLAGNTDENLRFGDIAIPKSWAHTGLWHWQKYGYGPDDELSDEDKGEFTRNYGYLNFANFTNKIDDEDFSLDNLLNNIWYQPEQIFPVDDGTIKPKGKERVFWIHAADSLFELAKKSQGMKLKRCIHKTTCLPVRPAIVPVRRGSSANMFVDNDAYKSFLNSKFETSIHDMESAAVALVAHQHDIPFIAIRALSDLPGESPIDPKEAHDYYQLLIKNCVRVITHFIKNLDDLDITEVSSI